jgi:hypothetical protein
MALMSRSPPALVSHTIEHFDHYTRRMVLFSDYRRVLLTLHELLLPCDLVYAAMFFHAQPSPRPPPRLPSFMQLQFQPLQLQRFLRSCVLATAHALATPPASVCRLVHARTRSRWIDCIFVRVMSGLGARAEVRQQAARCARALIIFTVSLMHCAANKGRYPGTISGNAGASVALLTAIVLHAHALVVRRLLPPPALKTTIAFISWHSEATSLPCRII